MGKIGDLWVKLGLKSDDYKKGMAEASKSNEGFKLNVDALKKVGVAAWTAMAAAVIKFAKDAISMTNKWGDEWNNTMAGIQSAYGTFVRQLSSGEGWSNLFQNMAEAYRKGKEIAAVLDEVFERKTSFGYQEAQINLQISELNKIMRDQSKSDAERKAAADAIIEKEEQLKNLKKDIWAQEAQAHRDNFKLQTGLNDEQTDFLVKEYNQNRAIIQQAVEYTDKLKELQKQRAGAQKLAFETGNTANYDALNRQIKDLEANTDQTIKDVAALVSKYNRGNDSLVKAMADAEVAVINIDTAANNASMRATTFLGSMASKASEAKREVIELGEKLEKLKEIMNPATTSDTGGLAGSAAREGMLAEIAEANSKYWQDMADAAEELAYTIEDSLVGAFDELANAMAGVEGSDMSSVATALLRPMADMAIKLGTVVLGAGEAITALKESLTTLGGAAPIAAGAALIAIGVAAKAGLAAIAKGGSATTTYSSGSETSPIASGTMTSELVVRVEGTFKGSDLVIAGQNTINSWNQ